MHQPKRDDFGVLGSHRFRANNFRQHRVVGGDKYPGLPTAPGSFYGEPVSRLRRTVSLRHTTPIMTCSGQVPMLLVAVKAPYRKARLA